MVRYRDAAVGSRARFNGLAAFLGTWGLHVAFLVLLCLAAMAHAQPPAEFDEAPVAAAEMRPPGPLNEAIMPIPGPDFGLRQLRHRARFNVSFVDGEVEEPRADGRIVKRRHDALQQARSAVPLARFARVFPGDSVVKIAAQYDVDPRKLALMNRTVVERVYTSPDVICVAWTHTVRDGETLEQLAGMYNIESRFLAELNDLAPKQSLHVGMQLAVPGEYEYHYQQNGFSFLQLTRHVDEPNVMPFDEQSMKMRRERIGGGESFQEFLAKHKVDEDFVRKMNGLGPDEVPERQWLLLEHSVEVNEYATLDKLAEHFQVPLARLCEVNALELNDELQPGQRLHIPIGRHMRTAPPANVQGEANSDAKVFEIELQEYTP